jgi:hypothetical protein
MTEINPLPLESLTHEISSGLVGNAQNNSSFAQPGSVSQEEHYDFRPGTRLWLAFMTLAVVTLMVALDGTSISVALPVSTPVNLSKKR